MTHVYLESYCKSLKITWICRFRMYSSKCKRISLFLVDKYEKVCEIVLWRDVLLPFSQ
jgi:hypothetical protein